MGNTLEEVLAERLRNEKIMHCPHCKKRYDLENKIPKMICSNQHNLCDECLQQLRPKNCPECKQMLWVKRKKNQVLSYILEMVSNKSKDKGDLDFFPSKKEQNRYHDGQPSLYNSIQSPSKKTLRLKTVKQQSIPNLNLELYNQQKQFKKKYSVANVFTITKVDNDSQFKEKEISQTFEQKLLRLSEEYHMTAFKQILELKKEPQQIEALDFTLSKMAKIFDFMPKFTSLTRLNLNKNKISKIQNISTLTSLTYLSLSDNQIEYIEDLGNLHNLKNLYLNKNKIQSIQNLNNLKALQFLGISSNSIGKIQGLNSQTQLKWLNLDMNYIKKIQGIAHMSKLEIILLSYNDITVFQGLEQLPALKQIYLGNNKIENVKSALAMKSLRKLRLDNNPGLQEDSSKQYERLLQYLEAKGKGIQKIDESCAIY